MADYYDQFIQGDDPFSTDLRYIAEATKKEPEGGYLGAAFREAWTPMAISRIYDRRSSQFEEDQAWEIGEDVQKDLDLSYNRKETEYLTEALSEQEFVARKGFIQEDRDRQIAIAESGGAGVVASLAFSLFDPVGIAAGLVTGPVAGAAKLSGIARTLTMAGLSGVENVAIERILMEGNTQSSYADLAMAFGMGSIIGGGISAVTRGKHPHAAAGADELDSAMRMDAESVVGKETLDAVRAEAVGPMEAVAPEMDYAKVTRGMETHEGSLTRETNAGNEMTAGRQKQSRKRIKELEAEIEIHNKEISEAQGEVTAHRDEIFEQQKVFVEEIGPKRDEVRAKYEERIKAQEERIAIVEANLEAARKPEKFAAKLWKEEVKLDEMRKTQAKELNALELDLKKKIAKAEAKFNKELSKRSKKAKVRRSGLQDEIQMHHERLGVAADARNAANKLRAWRGMDETTKIKTLYGDEIPTIKAEVEAQIASAKPYETGEIEIPVEVEGIAAPGPEASTVIGFKPTTGTVGAMRAEGPLLQRAFDNIPDESVKHITRFSYDGGNVPEDLKGMRIPQKIFGMQVPRWTRHLESIHTRLINSDNMAIRGLAYNLFEAPQGGTAAKYTAAARVKNNQNQIRSAMRNRLEEGMGEWGKSKNISFLDMRMKPDNFQTYHKQVILEVKYPGTFTDDSIINAAAGVRDQLSLAGGLRQSVGEAGFDNLDLDANYVPTILDETKIKAATLQNRQALKDLISLGYQRGKHTLPPDVADLIADSYIARSLDHSLTGRNFIRRVTTTDLATVEKKLLDAGIPPETVRDFFDRTMASEMKEHLDNRAKASFGPDISVELNGMKFVDLIDNDLPKLLESYTRDAAAGHAMGKLGFRSKIEVEQFLADVEKQSTNHGLNPVDIAEELQVLYDGVNLLYGRSLNPDAHSPFVRHLGQLRDATGFLRLQTVGISSIPEVARVSAQRGLSGVLEACPDLGIGIHGTKAMREGGKYSGQFKRADLEELEAVLGYVGEDHVLYPQGLRADNIEESGAYSRMEETINNGLAMGKRMQEVASGFRLVQGGGEKIAARSLGNQIKAWADGDLGRALSPANIKDAGWHDGFLDNLKTWMTENPATDTFEGRDYRLFNFGQMPADMQEQLQIGMHRLVMRDMQRPFVGETPTFMHKWLGQTMTQFRSFSLLSFEKQLLHDIRHDRAAGAVIAAHSAMMAYVAMTIKAIHANLGKDDAAEQIKNKLTGLNAVKGVINGMGQVAAWGIAKDGLATFGLLPAEMMSAPNQVGARGLTGSSVPVLGLAADVAEVGKNVADMVFRDKEGIELKTVKSVQGITPFGRAIGINQAWNAMFNLLDE